VGLGLARSIYVRSLPKWLLHFSLLLILDPLRTLARSSKNAEIPLLQYLFDHYRPLPDLCQMIRVQVPPGASPGAILRIAAPVRPGFFNVENKV